MERDLHIDQLSSEYALFSQDQARRVVKLKNSGGAIIVFGGNGQSRGIFSIDNYGGYPTHDALAQLVRDVIHNGVARS